MVKSDRRQFMTAAGTGAALLAAGRTSAAPERPNILWLVSEDNSPWLGCYGDPQATTPNLDRMAKGGVVFDNAFANVPVCAPARSTIHTGMYASCLGTEHMRSTNPMPEFARFFTAYLREAGYYCVNGNKTDYNTTGTPDNAWDDRRILPSLKGLHKKQPFFCFVNFIVSHESSLHKREDTDHAPAAMELAPYHPDTPEVRHDYAQYHDKITELDRQIGDVLSELDERGLSEDTIVIYFSDHGGVLPRSKRMLYDTGMRVPMIARFPKKYRHLSPWGPGERAERLVSFVDLAPTMLSLAGAEIPGHMQGSAFLGERAGKAPEFVYGFRGRMDERYDLSRAVTDGRWKYIRNFYPHLPRGRHLDYLWKMPAMQSWEAEYKAGRLGEVQSRFFQPKAVEELYDTKADPWEINNLADDPEHKERLERMRTKLRDLMFEIRDGGLLHEAEMRRRADGGAPWHVFQGDGYKLERLWEAAGLAAHPADEDAGRLAALLDDNDSGVRYWGAVGLSALGGVEKDALERALGDESPSVRIAAAEALLKSGDSKRAKKAIRSRLLDTDVYVGAYAADALYNSGIDPDGYTSLLKNIALRRMRTKTGFNAVR